MNERENEKSKINVYNKILFGKFYLVSASIQYFLTVLVKVPKLGIFCLSLFCLEELKMEL